MHGDHPFPLSPRAAAAYLLLPLLLLLAAPSQAPALSDAEEINFCLCTNIMARIMCKDTEDFDFVTTTSDGTHVFTVFYANKESQVRCFVSGAFVHLKAEFKRTEYYSVPYAMDPATMCATSDHTVPQCPARWTIRCCAEKNPEDIREEKALEFWSRPIPDLLRDELESGIAREQNATGSEEPAP